MMGKDDGEGRREESKRGWREEEEQWCLVILYHIFQLIDCI